MFLSFNFFCLFPQSLHHSLAPFLHGPSLKIGIGSSGKVFHGSEETKVHASQEISLTIPHSRQMNFDECWLQSFK